MANVKVIVKAIACADGSVSQNGSPLFDVASGATFDLITKLDGAANNGTWDGVDTLDFTSAACSPVTFQINAVNKESLSSGSTFNLITKLDGAVNSGSYDAPTDTLSFTSAACSPVALQINGTPQESIAAGATFNLIATLDGVAGGTYTPATDTLAFTSTGGWVRPSDWIAIPSLTAADERFYGVVAIFENGYNSIGVNITSLAANINWGDGTSVVSNGSTQTKVYNYSTISATIYQWPDGRNYKTVLVDITRVGGAITSIIFYSATAVNRQGQNNFIDIILSLPSATTIGLSIASVSGFRPMPLLQRLRVRSTGVSTNLLNSLSSLRVLEWDTLRGNVDNAFSQIAYAEVGNITITGGTVADFLFNGSRVNKVGNITANNLLGFGASYMFQNTQQLTQVGNINLALATNLNNMFSMTNGVSSLSKIGLITAPNATSLASMFSSCTALQTVSFSSCALVTNTSGVFGSAVSLVSAIMPNLTIGVDFSTTALTTDGAVIFGNSIGNASGAQTITITYTPFGQELTALNAAALAAALILTTKGYTIAN
jgi:hypothetical protein